MRMELVLMRDFRKPARPAHTMSHRKILGEEVLLVLLAPSVAGLFLFYIAPFAVSIYNVLIDDPVSRKFVSLANFVAAVGSNYFRMALANTAIFTGICITLNIVFPFILVLLLNRIKSGRNYFF